MVCIIRHLILPIYHYRWSWKSTKKLLVNRHAGAGGELRGLSISEGCQLKHVKI